MSERRIRENRRRRELELRRNIFVFCFTVSIICTLTLGLTVMKTNAKDSSEIPEVKYYTSIDVFRGDTLWTIAGEYADGHYKTTEDYIKEVMSINSLSDETIYAGQHLIVPYYSVKTD